MFMKDPKLRGAGEEILTGPEEIAEWVRCSQDFLYFCQNYAYITALDSPKGIEKIKFRPYQLRMLKKIPKLVEMGKRGMVVVAPRQCGKTTGFQLYILWYILFHDYATCAVISNKLANAKKVLASIKMTYRNLPLWLQKGIPNGGWSKESIELENFSKIIVGSATSESIRGSTASIVYMDEYAFVPKFAAEDFDNSVLPTIMSGSNALVFATSTPKGRNHFYSMVKSAKRPDGLFDYEEVHWREVPKYTEEFKKRIIATKGVRFWLQEYECSFLGSAKTLIPTDTLENLTDEEPNEELYDGDFKIWERPIKGAKYILGIDTSKGVGGDYSVIQVVKYEDPLDPASPYRQVAIYRSNVISIDDFAQICITISNHYNECEMSVENNDYGFLLASKIWYQYECDRIACFERGILGVRANKKNKTIANLALREFLSDGKMEVYDRWTQWEFSIYEEKSNGTFSAITGEHDDCVTSLLWACYWIKSNLEDDSDADMQVNPRFHISEKAKSRFTTEVIEGKPDGEFVLGKTPEQVRADSMEVDFLDERPAYATRPNTGSFLDSDDDSPSMQFTRGSGMMRQTDFFGGGHRNSVVEDDRSPSKGDDFGWL